ncbi:nucleotidyltransferase domain-containing protein [Roseofilum casamattae]|uniref:Nucleotidyltransferase family protein n=1 Tax=Roseofilum casamattae BLCC-M143 TaxID=3022442 RepID=A0ABT7BZR3_9CYAN|nr:nucleotidyltransferase family protein [Roseofilum casamattae]MDJ1183921.1 nucleotidyltransferase family protein [Roseofilum casamattae BLCC-M143]
MRPEYQLIFSCARTRYSKSDRDRILELLDRDLDWNLIIQLVGYHGLTSLFCWTLQQFPDLINPRQLQPLQAAFKENTCRNLYLTQELIKIARLFEQHNIPTLAFKGPVLAQLGYEHFGLREFVDLDILVPETAVHQASEVLREQGYLPQFNFATWQERRYLQIRSEHNFYSSKKDISIDLHWSIIPKYFSFHQEPERIWNNPEYRDTVTLGRQTIVTLSREALLLFLCAHSSKHDWSHICWVCDIAQLLHQYPELNWDWIEREVGNLGTQMMLELGLWLAYAYFDAPVPDRILSQLQNNSKIAELTRTIESEWFAIETASSSRFLIGTIYVQTMQSWRDRLWYWLDYVATPTPLEWDLIQLPNWLFSLYYPLRLLRLLWKYRPQRSLNNR